MSSVLNTYISQYLQIDQEAVGTLAPEDANLFLGNDPADGTASYNAPAATKPSPVWIDWNDLGGDLENHRLLDLDGDKGRDYSSFPQSNECVASSHVLSKMDLTYVASANNAEYAYFAVQRSNNNGDAGYYWLFTKKTPHQDLGAAPCSASQTRLTYDISGPVGGSTGDVLLAGHFHPNGTPLLRVFHATADSNGVSAVDAINFNSGLWQEDGTEVAAAAVNTTKTAPGLFGFAGVEAMVNGDLEPEVFAEAAVRLTAFTGLSVCGATFYGSVITRSSGSGGTSPDLKDLAGPALFNFGSVTATASLTPGCDGIVNYTASATGIDGSPLPSPTCNWIFDGNPSLNPALCTGSIVLPPGAHSATVEILDELSGCKGSASPGPVNAYAPVTAAAVMTGNCERGLTYQAYPGGGTGVYTYLWTFSPSLPGADLTVPGAVLTGVTPGTYGGSVTITDSHDGVDCPAGASASASTYAPLQVDLQGAAAAPVCLGDAADFLVTATGGAGVYTYAWTGCASTTATCTIDPSDSLFCGDQTVSVVVGDSFCGYKPSQPQTYSKLTTITVTTNPPLP